MKKLPVLLSLLLLLILTGCNNPSGEITANLGQEVELKVGDTVALNGESLKIKFLEAGNDSRCPQGATCIWQGEVSCQIEITFNGSNYTKTLIQPGLTQSPAIDGFKEYTLSFKVLPYPKVGVTIKPGEYRLQIVIEKRLLEDTKLFLRAYGEPANLQNVLPGTEITTTFDSTNSKFSGSSGCNSYGGVYQIRGSQISFSDIYVTAMACIKPGVMEQEQKYLSLLKDAQTLEFFATELTIHCADAQVLIFSSAGEK